MTLHRFEEDPVRMLRAIAFAARLDFALDPPIVEAIRERRHLMATASPARLIEEYYKILRSGAAERTFRMLADHNLLEPVTPELQRRASHEPLWTSLRALDSYRRRFVDMPIQLSNVLLVCPKCGKPTRTGARFLADGSKERYCKQCDAGIGVIAPAHQSHVKK